MRDGKIELEVNRPVGTYLSHLPNGKPRIIINLPESQFLYPASENHNIYLKESQ